MDVVNIFLTSELGEGLEDFVHDQRRFTFDRLGAEGPKRLVEGPMWAFVDWVISTEGQQAIANYKIDGQQLFFPNAHRQ